MADILLVDNGSLRADATQQLRKLGQGLSVKAGQKIHPVSLRHADQIPIEQLDGKKAQILPIYIERSLAQGQRHFIILPLFFGESKAIEYLIKDYLLSLQLLFCDLSFQIAEVICPLPKGEPLLVDILYDHIMLTASQFLFPLENIILVDHGSPSPRVSAVRQHLSQSLQKRFPNKIEQAVMERREGEKYLFNGELLKDTLTKKAKAGEKSAIVSLLFFLAGRHAGTGGDIEKICTSVMRQYPTFRIAICPLISEHQALITILNQRLKTVQFT